MFIVTTISFFVIRLAPGDPFAYESNTISPEIRQHWRHQFAYDRPIPEQFVRYISNVARGDFGYSLGKHRPVADVLSDAVPNTLLLVGVALALSVVLGSIVGVIQASRRGGWFDRASSAALIAL
jgi:peptide/nickel transport system permease protein